jgi:hypothetical protein
LGPGRRQGLKKATDDVETENNEKKISSCCLLGVAMVQLLVTAT